MIFRVNPSLHGLALFVAIVIICDLISSATNEDFKLRITGSVADILCSRRSAELSADAKACIDQQMHKNGKKKSGYI